jgi:hypothetical protein
MAKKAVLVLFLAVLAAGGVFAQSLGSELNLRDFGAAAVSSDSAFGLDLGFATPLSGASRQNSGFALDLLAGGSSGGFMTGSPFLAGLLNIFPAPIGLWSWLNKDWLGGGITAGLSIGGLTIAVISVMGDEISTGLALAGMGMVVASYVYGYIRGSSQCKAIRGLASATDDNPLSHISFAALPTGNGNFAGALTWSSSF